MPQSWIEWSSGNFCLPYRSTVFEYISKQSGIKRYIMVGGAGSLEVAPGKMLKETLTLPEPIKKILDEAAAILGRLRGEQELERTFFSPAAEAGEHTAVAAAKASSVCKARFMSLPIPSLSLRPPIS